MGGGEKTDWVGKEWAGLFFPRGKNGPAHSFPGEKTDWGEIPACYTGCRKQTETKNIRNKKLAVHMQQAFICYVKFENISKVPVLIIAHHKDEIKVPSIFCTLLYIL